MLYSFDNQRLCQNAQKLEAEQKIHQSLPTDEQLMARIFKQDESALTALYKRHTPLLRTIAGRILNHDADVDEVVQEVFNEIWKQAGRYDEGKGRALGWIVTMLRRRAIDKVRRLVTYTTVQNRFEEEIKRRPEEATYASVDCEVADSDRAKLFRDAISALPLPQQEAVKYAFYKGMSQREISRHTGIPLGTIKTRLELALKKLRVSLSFAGLDEKFCGSARG